MATLTPETGESGSELSRTTGASSNASLNGTQQQRRLWFVQPVAANVATDNMTEDDIQTPSVKPEVARSRRSMKSNVSTSITWYTAGNWEHNRQWVYRESNVTNILLAVMGKPHGQWMPLSVQSGKFNITMLPAWEFLSMNCGICVLKNGRKRLQTPWRRLRERMW